MTRFMNGFILGGVSAIAGAYYLNKNKDKSRQVVQQGRDVINKADNYLDKADDYLNQAEQKMTMQ